MNILQPKLYIYIFLTFQTRIILDNSIMSDTQNQLDIIRQQNKARQNNYYKSNKDTINEKRRELYKLGCEAVKAAKNNNKNTVETNINSNDHSSLEFTPSVSTSNSTCVSKRPEDFIKINETTNDFDDYIPYNDDDIDYLYERRLDDIITDEVEWLLFPKELITIIERDCKVYINLAKKMCHSLREQWDYGRIQNIPKRRIVYIKLVYKYIYDHKLCLDNFF